MKAHQAVYIQSCLRRGSQGKEIAVCTFQVTFNINQILNCNCRHQINSLAYRCTPANSDRVLYGRSFRSLACKGLYTVGVLGNKCLYVHVWHCEATNGLFLVDKAWNNSTARTNGTGTRKGIDGPYLCLSFRVPVFRPVCSRCWVISGHEPTNSHQSAVMTRLAFLPLFVWKQSSTSMEGAQGKYLVDGLISAAGHFLYSQGLLDFFPA